jgi:putative addiction module component (TIGR02574 family)
MTEKSKEVLKEALRLSFKDRASLTASLLKSLQEGTPSDVREAWEEEISKRIEEIDTGKVELVDWEEAEKRIFED